MELANVLLFPVLEHTFHVNRYGFLNLGSRFLHRVPESVTTWQGRHISMKRILIRLYDHCELANRHGSISW